MPLNPGRPTKATAERRSTSTQPLLRDSNVQFIVHSLELLYGTAHRRARFDPMEELVSCILSQHTSDKSSFPAFTRLKVAYPKWEDVVAAGEANLASTIKEAGLPNQKARSILGCLRAIYEKAGAYSLDSLYETPTPEALAWLKTLPGVGPKTASLVLCFSFGRDTIPVDTHVFRVASRLGLLPKGINEAFAHDYLRQNLHSGLAFRFHAALIQHGRNVCKAPTPACGRCPLTTVCPWFNEQRHSSDGGASAGTGES